MLTKAYEYAHFIHTGTRARTHIKNICITGDEKKENDKPVSRRKEVLFQQMTPPFLALFVKNLCLKVLRKRERDRQTDRQTETERHTERQREGDTQRNRDRQKEREKGKK